MQKLLTSLAAAAALTLCASVAQADCYDNYNVTAGVEQPKETVAMSTHDGPLGHRLPSRARPRRLRPPRRAPKATRTASPPARSFHFAYANSLSTSRTSRPRPSGWRFKNGVNRFWPAVRTPAMSGA